MLAGINNYTVVGVAFSEPTRLMYQGFPSQRGKDGAKFMTI